MDEISVAMPHELSLVFIKGKWVETLSLQTKLCDDVTFPRHLLIFFNLVCTQARQDDVSPVLLLESTFNIFHATKSLNLKAVQKPVTIQEVFYSSLKKQF